MDATRRVLFVALALVLAAGSVSATPLFFDDFEGTLGAWTGKSGGAHNGVIVADPLDVSNHVLHFSALNSGGDIFTTATYSDPGDTYVLSFDYLGFGGEQSTPDNFGGFAGWSHGLPGTHYWLAGTDASYAGLFAHLEDVQSWQHYEIVFSNAGALPIHVMLEDFDGSGGVAGDAYFDNVRLEAIPEPGTLLLLGSGLTGLALRRRRRG